MLLTTARPLIDYTFFVLLHTSQIHKETETTPQQKQTSQQQKREKQYENQQNNIMIIPV